MSFKILTKIIFLGLICFSQLGFGQIGPPKNKKEFEKIYNDMAGDKPGTENYKTFNQFLSSFYYLNDWNNKQV